MIRRYFPEYLQLALRMLNACNVRADEAVVLHTDPDKDSALVEAFYAASVATAGEVVLVTRPTAPTWFVDPPRIAVRAMAEAEFFFDMTSHVWNYTDSMGEILNSGSRGIQVLGEGKKLLGREPDPRVIERAKFATDELFLKCERVRVTSSLGTDFVASRGGRSTWSQDGTAAEPGKLDSIGGGMVNFAPVETEADGTIVVNGTINLPPDYMFIVKEHVRIDVEGGRIVKVHRDTEEGRLVDDWLHSQDPSMSVIAHLGFGIDHRSKIAEGDLIAWESRQGSTDIAFGANNFPAFQGQNPAPSHADVTLIGATMSFDDRVALDEGKFVDPMLQ
jgi:hypothetical protein